MSRAFASLLNANPELRPLLSKAWTLTTLEQHFAAIAPEFLADTTRVSDLEGGRLTLIARNAAIGAKLRQLAPDLVQSLRQRGCAVDALKIRIEVDFPPPSAPPRELGPHALEALQDLEQHLEDSPLKQAISRLTGHKSQGDAD
jgi:hypothetical protein